MKKIYLSRAQTRSMSAWEPIGDPTGGAAYGERNDPVTAVVGGSIASGLIGANAARGAASTQADAAANASAQQLQAAREANQMQWNMYQQNLANQSPYMQTGQTALAALSGGLGLGAPGVYGSSAQGGGYGASGGPDMRAQGGEASLAVMPGVTPIMPGGVTSGPTQNYGASNGAMQGAAGQYAGKFTDTFTPNDLAMDPSYKWRLQQGSQALNASAAARGMLGSGQNLKDITNYAQDAASQEYQNAYNRFNTNQSNLYNRIASLAGVGQTATNAIGAAGQTAAGNMGQNTMTGAANSGNYLTSGAAAQAGGQVGASNALSGAIGSGVGGWMGLQYMNGGSAVPAATPYNTVDMTGFKTPGANPWATSSAGSALGSGTYIP